MKKKKRLLGGLYLDDKELRGAVDWIMSDERCRGGKH